MTTHAIAIQRRSREIILLGLLVAFVVAQLGINAAGAGSTETGSFIVQGTSAADAKAAVRDVGGTVERSLPIVNGVEATLTETQTQQVGRDRRTLQVTENGKVGFQGNDFSTESLRIPKLTKSKNLWSGGIAGNGVTVALIDTGVYSHPDLAGRVIHCEDFSHEAGTEAHCADTFGHGTFMAGLIAGNGASSGGRYTGSAPEANIVSVKLAGFDGSTDVSTVLAGLQWVVAHRDDYGIKVLNLSLGTDSTQPTALSPLNYAVQRAWKSGITVIVSAGNSGPNDKTVLKPADDPFVVTVGSSNDESTWSVSDDQVPVFSSRGPTRSDGIVKPDLVAPGVHTVSLRSPGSAIDQKYGSTAVVDKAYFRGTGTSMSTAVVSGIAAQIAQTNPKLVPDQIKYRLTSTAREIATTDKNEAGAGIVDAYAAAKSTTMKKANQGTLGLGILGSSGLGLLGPDRGSIEIDVKTAFGVGPLKGEFKAQFDQDLVSADNLLGLVPWESVVYTTLGWDAASWRATSWATDAWAAASWRAASWRATTWEAASWRGTEWDNADWDAASWRSTNWDAASWRATTWQSKWYAAAWN